MKKLSKKNSRNLLSELKASDFNKNFIFALSIQSYFWLKSRYTLKEINTAHVKSLVNEPIILLILMILFVYMFMYVSGFFQSYT